MCADLGGTGEEKDTEREREREGEGGGSSKTHHFFLLSNETE